MTFTFIHLDEVRHLMLSELEYDVAADCVYVNPTRMTPAGIARWPDLLSRGIMGEGLEWVIRQLSLGVDFHHQIQTTRGPRTLGLHDITMFCDGEFNRYYIRGVCQQALQREASSVTVCRGKQVETPRLKSEQLIGTSLDAQQLLTDLRQHIGVETAMKVPGGPNSGLTVSISLE